MDNYDFRTIGCVTERVKSDKDNTARAAITTKNLDRHGTIVEPKGMDLQFFMENPVVLLSHGRDMLFGGSLPIGRATDLEVKRDSIIGTWEWVSDDEHPNVKYIRNQWNSGSLNAVSIGFIAKKVEEIPSEDESKKFWPDIRIVESELVEFSLVSVPSNRKALKKDFDTQMIEKLMLMLEAQIEQSKCNKDVIDKLSLRLEQMESIALKVGTVEKDEEASEEEMCTLDASDILLVNSLQLLF
jgi:phage head maturation protease